MKRCCILAALLLASCASGGLTPVKPVTIDWDKCDTEHLSLPDSEASWVWRDDAILMQEANHGCIDEVAKVAEKNGRLVMHNMRAYEQKAAPLHERVGYWLEGSGLTVVLAALLYILAL